MPKESRGRSLSFNSSRSSPYPCRSNRAPCAMSKITSESAEDVKEWEEARCPVCMEHPHNAVLLQCSSYDKGCRPYMCNTSYRHSNCLDQFRKTFADTKTDPIEEASSSNDADMNNFGTNLKQLKLICPLCRGDINGWIVVEAARNFMNSKTRSCACETCDYSGTYTDLRKHARLEHPLVRPSEADPERQQHWTRLEQERDLGDLLSTIQSAFGDERVTEDSLLVGSSVLSVIIFLGVSGAPLSDTRASINWPSPSRYIGQLRSPSSPSISPMMPVWTESMDMEADPSGREDDTGSLESFLGARRRSRSSRRQFRSLSIASTTQLWGEDMDIEGGSNSREDESGSSESLSGAIRRNQRRRR